MELKGYSRKRKNVAKVIPRATELKVYSRKRRNVAKAIPRDMLSEFPDDLLIHILSFLHPKYAVRTSALSSRWKDLYKGVTNMELFIEKKCLLKKIVEMTISLPGEDDPREIPSNTKPLMELNQELKALFKLREAMAASTAEPKLDTLDDDREEATTVMKVILVMVLMTMVIVNTREG